MSPPKIGAQQTNPPGQSSGPPQSTPPSGPQNTGSSVQPPLAHRQQWPMPQRSPHSMLEGSAAHGSSAGSGQTGRLAGGVPQGPASTVPASSNGCTSPQMQPPATARSTARAA